MNKWYFSLAALLLPAFQVQAQEAPPSSSDTRVIIIEEKTDRWGNKTVTRTERVGQFSDEELERIIETESRTGTSERQVRRAPTAPMERGYLGVMVENAEGGAKIIEVREDSPAFVAGLQNGDIISSVDDVPVTDMESLVRSVGDHKPGDVVKVHYTRDGEKAVSDITLGSRRDAMLRRAFGEGEVGEEMRRHEIEMRRHDVEMRRHEIEMHRHDEDMRRHNEDMRRSEMHMRRGEMDMRRADMQKERDQFMLEEKAEKRERGAAKPRFGVSIDDVQNGRGVLVREVYEGSIAAQAGLQEGDIITHFNGVEVNHPDALIEAVKNAPSGEKVKVQYTRAGKKMKEKVEL